MTLWNGFQRRFHLWLRLLAAFFLPLAGVTAGVHADGVERILHVDLRTLGAVGLEPPRAQDARGTVGYEVPPSLAFAGSSSLAVSFSVWNPHPALSTREQPNGGSQLFHTVLFDLKKGAVESEASWGTAHGLDRFLLLSSPSGKTLFLVSRTGEHQEHVQVLSGQALTGLQEFAIESVGLDAGSDSHFAYLLPAKKGYALFVMTLNALREGGTAPLQPVYLTSQETCKEPSFLADDVLVLTGECDSLTLLAPDGRVTAQRRFGEPLVLIHPLASSDGARFALWVMPGLGVPYQTEGAQDPIRVYDTRSLTTVSEVEFPPPPDGHRSLVEYALSADGSLLALIYGFDLTVYRLSPAVTAGNLAETANATERNKSSQVQGQQAPTVDVSLVSVADLRHDAIKVVVRIANRGTDDVTLAPQMATLQILGRKRKLLPALDPDRLAGSIETTGRNDARFERYGCELPGEPGAPSECDKVRESALEMERVAAMTAADVRSGALRVRTLHPEEQVEGAVFFAYQRKRGRVVLRIPVSGQFFELPDPGGR